MKQAMFDAKNIDDFSANPKKQYGFYPEAAWKGLIGVMAAQGQITKPDLDLTKLYTNQFVDEFNNFSVDTVVKTAQAPVGRQLAMILYTSGSTGKPKGVLLSHESQFWSLDTSAKLYGDRLNHRYIVGAPMFHMNATVSVKGALAAGASLVLLPAFDAKVYAHAIDRYRVPFLTSVPTMLALVAKERELVDRPDSHP